MLTGDPLDIQLREGQAYTAAGALRSLESLLDRVERDHDFDH